MSFCLNANHIVSGVFGGLEPSKPEWTEQFDYWEDYVRKFFASNGMSFDPADSNVENWLMADDRAPYADMVRELLPQLKEMIATDDVDAILFAHWLPDVHLGTSVTNYAMHNLGLKDCFGFAISDRGLSAPFFAFDSLYKYLQKGRRKGLMIVADQKHAMYKSDIITRLNPLNAACIVPVDTRNNEGLVYHGYARSFERNHSSHTALIANLFEETDFDPAMTTLIGPADLLDDVKTPAQQSVTNDQLVCAAPFVALGQVGTLERNQILLCKDGGCVTSLAFGAPAT